MSNSCCEAAPGGTPIAVSARLVLKDCLGALKVRLGWGRNNYRVRPGLYALGRPDPESPVLASANYKLTFDTLRKNLSGLDAWLLILDTQGVNVWCAAGKGTFGTRELIRQVIKTRLAEKVTHRRLFLPQLGAPGVRSPEVLRLTGFTVSFGPVRAKDIKAFLAARGQATRDMRRVNFTLWDRLILAPVEFTRAARPAVFAFGVMFILNLVAARPFGRPDFILLTGTILTGTVLTPALLPWVPGPAFSWKGGVLGLIWALAGLAAVGWFTPDFGLLSVGYILLLPALSAWLALNFTGSSTCTSPSGVLKEMRIALPLILSAAVLGAVLVLAGTL